MEDFEFVDVEKFCPSILVEVIYATQNNFTKRVLYPVSKCFLRKGAAVKLCKVQKKLEKMELGLKIFDGYRPFHVTQIFWDLIGDIRYVADPKIGSKHNRGAAVDVTLVDSVGNELAMPTPVDEMSLRAHRDYDNLPKNVIANRELLEEVMAEGGFTGLATEWWHYDDQEWSKYPIEDICLSKLVCHA